METFWFIVLLFMLTMYVILDGFDFGSGIVYLYAARTDMERRMALQAIGPVWNGNEVWLIASGGLIFFAFPKAYASGFSGFYLALMMVLWLLMGRGLALELRSHIHHPLWQTVCDHVFAVGSFLLALVFGAALGNLVRGVPLNKEGYFFTPFWTDFSIGPAPGILDWFTTFMGFFTIVILTAHGANYLAMKTEGELYERAHRIAWWGSWAIVGLLPIVFVAVGFVQPLARQNFNASPLGYTFPLLGILALGSMLYFRKHQKDVRAFLASSFLIFGLLSSVGWALYPNILIATTNPQYSLTIHNAAAGSYGLQVGLLWFSLGIVLVLMYMIYVYRSFWGKVPMPHEQDSY